MKEKALELAATELQLNKDELSAEAIDNPFFKQWKIWRVSDGNIPPQVLMVATTESEAHKITIEEGFAQLAAKEPVKIASNEEAKQYIEFFLSVADPMIDILSSVDDIPGISKQDKDQWEKQVRPPIFHKKSDIQYTAMMWLYKQGELFFARTDIQKDGSITMQAEKEAENIGVGISIE
jgi:hypothetical protein